jgi:GT2 family glycosyltransferase/glycosyltransferase involved in cell wall biosynthesis
VLLGKILRRLRATPLAVSQRPHLLRLEEPYPPLRFPRVADPSASIIVPVYNKYSLTAHCLVSLHRHLSAHPFEVILVDDCSTDETPSRLRAFENLQVLRNRENLGFVGSCNAGAARARGLFLVFLNNDTQVQPGWLDALIDTFSLMPDAGLVGSRLIFPDGRQQEAGGILFQDASSWNYGHLEDPYKPKFCYLRESDYVSGASLAIRRDLFQMLGGFDAHFAPAYYEDADLAFRARAAGYRVYYQPLSQVVHFEGATAGTDETASTGMKRYQALNRHKLLERWRPTLAALGTRGQDLERQKERQVRRRAFVVDIYMPTPDKESGSLRMVNLLAILQKLGFKVTFAATNLEAPAPYLSSLQMRGIECLYRPYVKSLAKHLRQQGEMYDLVILSRADAAAKVMPSARRYCTRAKILFDTVDLHFLREERLAALTGDKATMDMARRRKRQELELVEFADTTLVVSEVERRVLAEEAPAADVRVVSNIHQIFGSASPFEQRRDILFIGAFAHPPNGDAVRWLADEILPSIHSRLPSLRCHIIGADPPREIRALANDRLKIHGYVPDVKPFFDACRLSVAPLRYGAGVKGKVNQSLAYGLPVVATPQAAEGMFLEDGKSVLLADDPSAFASAVIRLYQDDRLWSRLSAEGIRIMERHFSFAAATRALEELIGD